VKAASSNDNQDILQVLGFNSSQIVQDAENYTAKTHNKAQKKINPLQPQIYPQDGFTNIENVEGFYDDLVKTKIKLSSKAIKESTPSSLQRSQITLEDEQTQNESFTKNVNWNTGVEKVIKENLIIGNYEGAIDCALKVGRIGEALLIGHSVSQDLFI